MLTQVMAACRGLSEKQWACDLTWVVVMLLVDGLKKELVTSSGIYEK